MAWTSVGMECSRNFKNATAIVGKNWVKFELPRFCTVSLVWLFLSLLIKSHGAAPLFTPVPTVYQPVVVHNQNEVKELYVAWSATVFICRLPFKITSSILQELHISTFSTTHLQFNFQQKCLKKRNGTWHVWSNVWVDLRSEDLLAWLKYWLVILSFVIFYNMTFQHYIKRVYNYAYVSSKFNITLFTWDPALIPWCKIYPIVYSHKQCEIQAEFQRLTHKDNNSKPDRIVN